MKRYIFGEWRNAESPLTVEEAKEVLRIASERRSEMAQYPLDKIWAVLDKLKAKWSDPGYGPRVQLLEELPKTTGFSAEMIQLAMDELSQILTPENLAKKLKTELRNFDRDQWQYSPDSATRMKFEPLGTVLHVLSGNVFLVGVGSWLEGLITGNVTILKMASSEQLFLPKFIESLNGVDIDGVVKNSVAIVDYSSSQSDVMSVFKKGVDGIVVWGGEDAVRAYRNDLPARTKVIVYGPKLSVAVITNEGFRTWGPEKAADKLAYEMAIWDQNACTAPQVCYVEGKDVLNALIEPLSVACQKWERELPAGPAEMNQAVEIQKLRSVAELMEGRSEGFLRKSDGNVNWTIYTSADRNIDPSPLHRTLKLVAVENVNDVLTELEKMRGYIQTIGLSAGVSEFVEVSEQILKTGALRVLELGQMSGGEIDDPHDGAYDLEMFGHFVYARLPNLPEGVHPTDLLSKQARKNLIERRLRTLVRVAMRAPFYAKRLAGLEIQTVEDLKAVKPLTRDEMDSNMPPKSQGLQAANSTGGYVSRSGGSTGEPKYSVYDQQDWENMISEAVRVLRSAGVAKGDRVANCMLSGDLYGSFVSFDHINSRLGARTFAFAGHVNPESFLDTWRKFQINVLQAMPTVIMPLVKICKQQDKNFTLEKIIYAGTPLSQTDREWLKNQLGVKSICSIIGANDGGQLAFQCGHLTNSYHHLVDDFNYVELLNGNNEPVAEGEPGKIVITSLLKYQYPLIRYEIGDSARFVNKACTCGRTNRIIEYLGRSDDAICVALMNLPYRDIAKALRELPLSVIQLVAQNSLEGEWLTLRIECENHSADLISKIQSVIFEQLPIIKTRRDEGQLLRFEVVLFSPGELPRNPRTGKVKLVVDERV